MASFIDRIGEMFIVDQLSKELAIKHGEILVSIHNEIPFQNWTVQDLLSEDDNQRSYFGKWEISTIIFNKLYSPIGLCIGFELQPDMKDFFVPGIYMHRLALLESYRRKYIGAISHAETLSRVFSRGLRHLKCNDPMRIYGQTNNTTENQYIIDFHLDAGFNPSGIKRYHDREDLIMCMSHNDFVKSKHAELREKMRLV